MEHVAYSQHKFDSSKKEYMFSATLGFPGDMSYHSITPSHWHWRSQVFRKGGCHHDLKAFCESGHNNYLKILSKILSNDGWYII